MIRYLNMIKIQALAIPIILSITLFVAACSNNTVSLGQEFSLRIDESASIQGEDLQIKFLKVTEDSRCPTGIMCVWEGRVSCLVKITYQGYKYSVLLTEPGSSNWPSEKIFKEYKIAYHVEPYPQASTEIAEDIYRLNLKISK